MDYKDILCNKNASEIERKDSYKVQFDFFGNLVFNIEIFNETI